LGQTGNSGYIRDCWHIGDRWYIRRDAPIGDVDLGGNIIDQVALDLCAFGALDLATHQNHITSYNSGLFQFDLPANDDNIAVQQAITYDIATNYNKVTVQFGIRFNGYVSAKKDKVTIEGFIARDSYIRPKHDPPAAGTRSLRIHGTRGQEYHCQQ